MPAPAHPSRSTWIHHLELRLAKDVDRELIGLIRRAYEEARQTTLDTRVSHR